MQSSKKLNRNPLPFDSTDSLLNNIQSYGDKPAYLFYTGPKSYDSISFKDFAHKVRVLASGIDAMKLAGKKIAILGESSVEWIASYLAIVASGSVAIPLDKELDITEMEGLLSRGEIEGLCYSKSFEEKLTHTMQEHPTLKFFICMGETTLENEKVMTLNQLEKLGGENTNYTLPKTDKKRLAEMLFTSGTTGTSKCVMLSEENIFSSVKGACETVPLLPSDSSVSILPLHHTYELCCIIAELNLGMTVGINDSLKHIIPSMKLFQPTTLILVPLIVNTMYKKIMDEIKRKKMEKKVKLAIAFSKFLRFFGIDKRRVLFKDILATFGGNLKWIVCGGAPLNPKMCDVFYEFGVQLMEGYGITECSPLIAVNTYYKMKAHSVGPTIPYCEAKISKDVKTLQNHDMGEVCVKGSNVMLGYYKNDQANQEVFEDGWFKTGDMGYMDKDGYLYITGRYKSVIVLENGKNVFPEEIEEYLASVPKISETVVVGRLGSDFETVVLTALIVPDMDQFENGISDEDLRNYFLTEIEKLNKNLPTFKHIKEVEIRHEEFPKTTSRKIKRHLVK